MKDRQLIADVFDRDIVGNHIALQPRLQRLAKFRLGVDYKEIRINGKEDMRIELAFRI